MNKESPRQTKICSVCGIRKPLEDFVVDPSKRLKEYSDICQKCRGIQSDKQTSEDEDGAGGKEKNLSLDYFAKRFMEELQKKWVEEQQEKSTPDLFEEKEISEQDQTKADKTEQKAKIEGGIEKAPSKENISFAEDIESSRKEETPKSIEISEVKETIPGEKTPETTEAQQEGETAREGEVAEKDVILSPDASRSKYGNIFTATAFGNWARSSLLHIIRRESFANSLFEKKSTESPSSEKTGDSTKKYEDKKGAETKSTDKQVTEKTPPRTREESTKQTKPTENQTTVTLKEKTTNKKQTVQTTTEQEIIATNLFRTEKQQTLKETAKVMTGGTSQTTTTTQMFERYAKIESPAIKSQPPITPKEPSKAKEERTVVPRGGK